MDKNDYYISDDILTSALESLRTTMTEAEYRKAAAGALKLSCVARFRSLNTYAHLETLLSQIFGKLYFSSARGFNDPYDTLMYVDYPKALGAVGRLIKRDFPSYLEDLKASNPLKHKIAVEYLGLSNGPSDKQIFQFLCCLEKALEEIKQQIRDDSRSICFSKNFLSTIQWSHYADNHSGVVLLYNKFDLISAKCFDRSNKPIDISFKLYDVKYSKDRPDGTELILDYFLYLCGKREDFPVERLREIILTKDAVWEYENETRLLPTDLNFEVAKDCSYLEVKPKAIIMGAKISEEHKVIIQSAAEKAGCLLYEAWYDENRCDYNVVFQQVT